MTVLPSPPVEGSNEIGRLSLRPEMCAEYVHVGKRRFSDRFVSDFENRPTIEDMNISKADAVAHLAKWYDAGTQVLATYTTITGMSFIIGTIKELSPAGVKVIGAGCELLLYFRTTSEYDYTDAREAASEANKNRENKYPTVIDVRFSGGDRLKVSEFFRDSRDS